LIAKRNLLGIGIVHDQRLFEDKQVLLTPGAGQGFENSGFIGFAVVLAEAGQHLRVPFTADDCPEDLLRSVVGELLPPRFSNIPCWQSWCITRLTVPARNRLNRRR
jgi:hypothetical protein